MSEASALLSTLGVDATYSPARSLPRRAPAMDPNHRSKGERADGAGFEVLGSIGEGGMGTVLRAWQAELQREVALKRVKAGAPPVAATCLVREARLAGALEHPNIVPVHGLVFDDADPTLVMKRVEGVTLQAIADDPHHPVAGADRERFFVETILSLGNAVAFAHQRGVVHRDIKPENVMVGAFGEVLLMDWGIALRFREEPVGPPVGTPAFWAPEMMVADPVDPRTDVYLLAGTLFACLNRRPPHGQGDLLETMRTLLEGPPPACEPEVPEELAAILSRGLSSDPERRPSSVERLQAELRGFLQHRAAEALAAASTQRLARAERLDGDPRALISEARFGLEQALQMHPESRSVRAALDGVLERFVRLELATGQLEAARSWRAQMHAPSEALDGAIRSAEAKAAAKAEHTAALEAFVREESLARGASRRSMGLALFALLSLLVSAAAPALGAVVGAWRIVAAQASVASLALLGLAWRFRRDENRRGRRLGLGLVSMVAFAALFSALGLCLGVEPAVFMSMESLSLGLGYALIGLALDGRVLWAVPVVAMGVGFGLLMPEHRIGGINLALYGSLAVTLLAISRPVREPPVPD